MQKQSEFARNIHDNPVMRLKAADEEARRKSPIGKLKSKHDDERRELNNKIVHESREVHLRHTVERGNAAQLSRPELAHVEERRKEQVRDMNNRHAEARRAMAAKHDREIERLR